MTADKVPKRKPRHPLNCPCCNVRIIDSSLCINSKLYDMEVAEEITVDYYAKCKRCKKEIGIQKIANTS